VIWVVLQPPETRGLGAIWGLSCSWKKSQERVVWKDSEEGQRLLLGMAFANHISLHFRVKWLHRLLALLPGIHSFLGKTHLWPPVGQTSWNPQPWLVLDLAMSCWSQWDVDSCMYADAWEAPLGALLLKASHAVGKLRRDCRMFRGHLEWPLEDERPSWTS
jgi:hypothetical protein